MEFTKLEVAVLEQAHADVAAEALTTLGDLELSLIGGGVGEVIFG